MAKLVWDADSKRLYETGVDHGVLYLKDASGAYTNGVAWNGLTAVNESPSGAEANDLYADNIKYLSLRSAETFGASVEAYTYPDEFAQCDGSAELAEGVMIYQQARKPFGLSYRTLIGNDVDGQDHGYKLHLIYGCTASPSDEDYETVNDSPDAMTFSWDVDTIPVVFEGHEPTSEIVIDSRVADPTKLKALEDKLYGTAETEPTLPLPNEVITMMNAA